MYIDDNYRMTNDEVIHNWANRNFKGINVKYWGNSVSCTKDKLWVHNRLVARFLNNSTVIIEKFDYTGAFGTGIGSWHISSSIPRAKDYYTYSSMLTDDIINNENAFIDWYRNEFINGNCNTIDKLAHIEEFATNNLLSTPPTNSSLKLETDEITLPKSIYKKYEKRIKKIDVTVKPRYNNYHGWGRYRYSTYDLPKITVKMTDLCPVIDITKFIDSETIEKYKYRLWHTEYCRGYGITPKESKKIYCDPKLKEEREKGLDEFKKKREEREKERAFEKNRQALKHYLDRLEAWKKSDSNQSIYFNFSYYSYTTNNDLSYQVLKKIKNNVITSMGVMVSLDEAKRAYDLFQRYKDTEISFGYDSKIRVGNYTINSIGEKIVAKIIDGNISKVRCKAITIGCHVLPDFEIEDFINRYNLEW